MLNCVLAVAKFNTNTHNIYIYIYIYMCVCVCARALTISGRRVNQCKSDPTQEPNVKDEDEHKTRYGNLF
jgi:hypothetical protein